MEWDGATPPGRDELRGSYVVVRPVDPVHDAHSLFAESHPADGSRRIWTYLPTGPYESQDEYARALEAAAASEDPLFFAIVPLPDEQARGIASYLRIAPADGTIEIGHIWFGTSLQRTAAATEAIYLLARHAFDDLGYRRFEWKCNALNAPSRRAAERFGFTCEGIFRQHMVVKGRNRDTAWYSMLDAEWAAIRDSYERWLAPENFDAGGVQRSCLRAAPAERR